MPTRLATEKQKEGSASETHLFGKNSLVKKTLKLAETVVVTHHSWAALGPRTHPAPWQEPLVMNQAFLTTNLSTETHNLQ